MQRDIAVNPTMRPVSTGENLVTFSTYKERQDVLKNTTVMDYREDQQSDANKLINVGKLQPIYSNGIDHITSVKSPPPPPPLEFMGSRPLSLVTNKLLEPRSVQKPKTSTNDSATHVEMRKAPNSPVPDYEYDQVQVRGTIPKSIQSKHRTNTDRQSIGGNTQRSTQSVQHVNNTSGNRRTMLLGTVTIGEYTTPANGQNQYKQPAKFDFITTKKMNSETDAQHHQPTMLHSELQNTLSKSNLKKRTTNHLEFMEHQSHCHLVGGDDKKNLPVDDDDVVVDHIDKEHEYTNVEKLTRMLQCKQNLNDTTSSMRPTSYQHATSRKKVDANVSNFRNENSASNGILKNGNGNKNNRNSLNKSTEKTISFGN